MVSAPALQNPLSPDGCFPGYRYVNKNVRLVYAVDIVPPLLKTSRYAHNAMEVSFLDQNNGTDIKDCGWWGMTFETTSISLHSSGLYVDRATMQGGPFRDAARVALAAAYVWDTNEAKSLVSEMGYNLVATAVVNDEASHLIQHPRTLACYITFEGTTGFDDWLLNVNVIRVNFCGLGQGVHNGFRQATLRIVDTTEFQRHVRPKLGKCSKVEAVGHSLGGAIASLFTACAHSTVRSGQSGWEDYQKFFWNKERATAMPSL